MEARTFREAYSVLQEHAQTLREQKEPNIDELLAIVTESVAAYKVCKERIDAVDKALQAALTDVGGDVGARVSGSATDDEPAGAAPSAAQPPGVRPVSTPSGSSGGLDDMDRDIPI